MQVVGSYLTTLLNENDYKKTKHANSSNKSYLALNTSTRLRSVIET